MGFSYSKRAGGRAQYAHLQEVADVAIGQDPSDIDRIYQSLLWAGASVGRSGVATQAIAALDVALWDLKARRADLPLAKLIGAHRDSCQVYNTSGGFLQASVEEIKEKATASLEVGHRRHQNQSRPTGLEDRPRAGRRHPRAPRRHPVHGRRQPAVGPRPRQADVPGARSVRPGLDRGTARRVGRRRSRRPQPHLRHPDRDRRDADVGARAHGADRRRLPRHRSARRPADRRHHAVPALRDAGRARRAGARAALRDGDPPAPGRNVSHRAVGRALRMAQPAVQRAHRDPRRPDVAARSARPRIHPQRPDAGPHQGERRRSARDDAADDNDTGAAGGRRAEGQDPRRRPPARPQAAVGGRAHRRVTGYPAQWSARRSPGYAPRASSKPSRAVDLSCSRCPSRPRSPSSPRPSAPITTCST